MTGIELVYLVAALGGVLAFILALRRAARKQLGEPRARPELPEAPKPKARPKPKPEPEPEPEEEEAPEEEEEPEPEPEEPVAGKAADAETLRAGLAKTRGGFISRLGKLFAKKTIDASLLDELEEVLLTADIGPKTADRLFRGIKDKLSRDELDDPEAVWTELRRLSTDILAVEAAPVDITTHRPFVLLIIGVNGAGKTTTIGKLAAMHVARGKKVMLAAGDTFRAAAVEQLEVWGQRAGAPVVRGKAEADPSSVIFDAIRRAADEEYDLLIADTAGRLQTKVDLMEELRKVRRVCDKAMPGCPHETWLVLDATTGQNAISQATLFREAMDITGIVITKLDGTAKGGVILGICDELGVPVRYIGIGEKVEDLRPFDPEAFVDALYAHDGD